MALGIVIVSLLVLFLGLSQAWTIWYLKREVARLEQRLEESLDDQDLLDFQSRLQDLMGEARSTGTELVAVVARRQEALEKSLLLAREAEKKIAARAQVLEKVADSIATRAEKLKDGGGKGAKKAVRRPRAEAPLRAESPAERPAPAAPKDPEKAEATDAGTGGEELGRERSYFLRPALAAPAPGSRQQRVYEAADRGLNREQIARETGMLPGEVELILNLRPKKKG